MSTAPSPAERRASIDGMLKAAGLTHAWEPGDEPVASLSVQLPNRSMLALTVRHDGTVLQLIAHGALIGPAEAQLLADRDNLNQAWGIGRVYYAERAQVWDLSAALYCAGRAAPVPAVLALLATLADAPDLIAQGQPPAFLVEPAYVPSQVLPGVVRALDAAGLRPAQPHGGEVASVVLQMDRMRVRVDCFLAGGTMLIARANPLGVPVVSALPAVLRSLNALNGRLDIGGVGLAYEHGLGHGWIAHPVAWFDASPEALRWTCERAASWAEAAHEAAVLAMR